jgi:hypothetical protein
MGKKVEIFYCGDCPWRYYEYNDLCCELADGRLTSENCTIPEWCPLSDE